MGFENAKEKHIFEVFTPKVIQIFRNEWKTTFAGIL